MTLHLCLKYDENPRGYFQKNSVGVWSTLAEILTLFQTHLWFSLPYFRPEALEPSERPERLTSCYNTYTVGVNIEREMVLSPNDEEEASSKKHTQFMTRVTKVLG